ncbi:hypothetical protein RhiirC2_855044 [Rhizophagus irregularis]|uniref:Uncharacterized protein n=1 Tax=Rhizophagus irregularis TaxID=588596 RepID=A0A2N1MP06_9GLOM|nr:hypothetical protein RhiirC2_855044 [Rhizophagus irregularis]
MNHYILLNAKLILNYKNHPDFWSYLYEVCEINKNDFTKFGIVNEFSKYMYKEHGVYFVSNLINLNSELCQFQESGISSLSGLVMSSKNENLHLVLPKLENNYYDNLICKMNNYRKDYMLKHKDVSKLEGLGWIEYQISIYGLHNAQLSIEINSIEMQIEYVRFDNPNTITYIPDMSFMSYLLPDYHKFFSNVPETFKDNSKDLNDILTKIDQIFKHYYEYDEVYEVFGNKLYKLLYFIKCKICIELKEYNEARLALNNIPYYEFESISHFIQDHSDFRSYLCEFCEINKDDFTEFGIVDEFSKYMYKEKRVYFLSNITNLNSELCQFQESDISSLSGLVLSSKNENLHLVLPKLNRIYDNYLICKMNVKKILSKDCFIKFIHNSNYREDNMLKHKDVSKLEGLGWIEYQTRIRSDFQLLIEINSIEMKLSKTSIFQEKKWKIYLI